MNLAVFITFINYNGVSHDELLPVSQSLQFVCRWAGVQAINSPLVAVGEICSVDVQ